MSMVPIRIREAAFLTNPSNHGMNKHYKHQIICGASWKIVWEDLICHPSVEIETYMTLTYRNSRTTLNSNSTLTNIKEKFSVAELGTNEHLNLQLNEIHKLDRELADVDRIEFVAREAFLDEEFWQAAWLRAESHWEDRTNERYINNYKRKFAEQEFHALKRRSSKELKSSCIVAVEKEDNNIKSTVVKSVVGTLDVSIRYFLSGKTFPGEKVRAPLFSSLNKREQIKYGYIENLCVSKSARRKGIAMNMLLFAVNTAKAKGAEQVFVYVYRDNKPAHELYHKLGFEVVERANAQLWKEKTNLLCLAF